jgi:hypothetical protein
VVILLLAGCTGSSSGPAAALQVLSRASLDVRGVRPSEAEADAILADPTRLDDRIADLLGDPRFGTSVASTWADIYGTRATIHDVAETNLALEDETVYLASVGEEPLRLLAWIADHDRPYTDIVRADYTVVDDVLAARYPVDYPVGDTGWQQAHYVDGRPAAGVLSTAGFWWRYRSTYNNANRGRANAVSRIFLCNDYLSRTVEFPSDLDLTDEDAVLDALRTQQGCVACHHALDPLGAYFWGEYREFSDNIEDLASYYPDRERYWTAFGVAPAYYGEPGDNLEDLGRQMAADPRLVECVTQQAYELLLQRPVTLADTTALNTHREALLAGGVTLRALYRSVLTDPAYRATSMDDPEHVPWKMMSADQFASAVEDLTGYRMGIDGHDVIAQDYDGMRTMAAGAGTDVGTAAPTPTLVEVEARIAEAAAGYAANRDARSGDAPLLFTHIDIALAPAPGSDAMVAQIQALYERVLGQVVAADSDEVATTVALWSDLYALDSDPVAAWAGVLTVLLRDPDFLTY